MNITRDELGAAIDEAHKRGMKLTGHLCSVTYSEAIDLGIDDLEHGFMASTDFVPTKAARRVPGAGHGPADDRGARSGRRAVPGARQEARRSPRRADVDAHRVRDVHARPAACRRALDVLLPELKQQFEATYQRTQGNAQSVYATLFPKGMALERAFAKAGGLLVAGTDPTGSGGVIPGYSDQRQIELLVEEGFTPLEAISDLHAQRREVSRPRRDDWQPGQSASRPTWCSSAATRRRPSPTSGRSRPSSVRVSASIPPSSSPRSAGASGFSEPRRTWLRFGRPQDDTLRITRKPSRF